MGPRGSGVGPMRLFMAGNRLGKGSRPCEKSCAGQVARSEIRWSPGPPGFSARPPHPPWHARRCSSGNARHHRGIGASNGGRSSPEQMICIGRPGSAWRGCSRGLGRRIGPARHPKTPPIPSDQSAPGGMGRSQRGQRQPTPCHQAGRLARCPRARARAMGYGSLRLYGSIGVLADVTT